MRAQPWTRMFVLAIGLGVGLGPLGAQPQAAGPLRPGKILSTRHQNARNPAGTENGWRTGIHDPVEWSAGPPTGLDAQQPGYVPNRLIIRLRENNPTQANATPYSKRKASHRATLAQIERDHNLKLLKPVFATLHTQLEGHLSNGRDLDVAALGRERQARFPSRSRRVPGRQSMFDLLPVYVFKTLDSQADIPAKCAALTKDPAIEYAEPDYVVSIDGLPNDPLFEYQWPLHNTAQLHPRPGEGTGYGTQDADVDAPEAWDAYVPTRSVVVAIVDTGVDYAHPDLAANMWTDVDGFYGYDFSNNDSDPMDDHGHGTHVAGIVAAVHGNGLGISGVCPDARIMALKFLDEDARGPLSLAEDAFYYAVANGADVISNSWSSDDPSDTLLTAVEYAHSQGVLLVASAGNENSHFWRYPAKYSQVVSVAATDCNDRKAGFSTYGDLPSWYWVDLAAPGVHILSLYAGQGSYLLASGTSMSCPHVAGGLALLLSAWPDLTADEITQRLLATTDDITLLNPGYEKGLGTGRLNLHRALTMTPRPRFMFSHIGFEDVVGNGNDLPEPGETIELSFELENIWLDAKGVTVHLIDDESCLQIPIEPADGDVPTGSSVAGAFSFDIPPEIPLPHRLPFRLVLAMTNGPTQTKLLPVDVSWPLREGWPYQYSAGMYAGEALAADLDDDGTHEIVLTGADSLAVVNTDGSFLSDTWPLELLRTVESWAIGNLDADVGLEMLGFRTDHGAGSSRQLIYTFNMDGTVVDGDWPKYLPSTSLGGNGHITLVDLDGDGVDEVVVTTQSPWLYVFSGDGSIYGNAWPKEFLMGVNWHVAIADLDGDGHEELIAVTGGPYAEEHEVRAYHADGTMAAGWPFVLDEAPWTGAVVGDINGDGLQEVAFTTLADEVYVLNSHGDLLSSAWPVRLLGSWGYNSIALGDLDNDGLPEILVAGDQNPYIHALNHQASSLPGWPAIVDRAEESFLPYVNRIHAVADVDGDGLPEVIVGTHMGPYVFNHDGTRLPGAAPLRTDSRYLRSSYYGAMSVSDIDGDADVEILMAIGDRTYVFDFAGDAKDIQWARYRADVRNTGHLKPIDCNDNGIADRRDLVQETSDDCNTNGTPDECDLGGDADGDNDVDLADHALFVAMMSGPSTPVNCSVLDSDGDGDIDLKDHADFAITYSGSP